MVQSPRKNSLPQKGFSLVELLIVLAIMATIATLVAPRLFNQVDRSKQSAAMAQIRSLKTSVDALRLDIGRYPTAEEGLALLSRPPSDTALRQSWFGPYIEGDMPLDPWDQPYVYAAPEMDAAGFPLPPTIKSLGADGQEGGEGLNADISI